MKTPMTPPLHILLTKHLDVTAPDFVDIEWDATRRVLYVNISGVTVLRCCQVDQLYHNLSLVQSEPQQ